MRVFLGLLGIGILLVTIYDVLWTTLRLTSGGPITSWVTDALWKLSTRLTRSHKALATLGFFIVLLTVALWVLLVWTGWTLVMGMSPRAVLESATGRPADLWSRIYFAGSTIITMNISEYRPGSAGWQIVSTIAAANGFSLVSLIITYLLPIVGAELERRRLAVYITSLGRTPHEILLRAWDGSDFGKLPDHLIALTLPMMEVGQSHLAYPVLHCVHSRTRETALAPSVAVLDEAITLFAGVCPEQRPPPPPGDRRVPLDARRSPSRTEGGAATTAPPRAVAGGGDHHREGRGIPTGPGNPHRPAAPAPRPRRGRGLVLGGRHAFELRHRETVGDLGSVRRSPLPPGNSIPGGQPQFTHSPASSFWGAPTG